MSLWLVIQRKKLTLLIYTQPWMYGGIINSNSSHTRWGNQEHSWFSTSPPFDSWWLGSLILSCPFVNKSKDLSLFYILTWDFGIYFFMSVNNIYLSNANRKIDSRQWVGDTTFMHIDLRFQIHILLNNFIIFLLGKGLHIIVNVTSKIGKCNINKNSLHDSVKSLLRFIRVRAPGLFILSV